MNYEAFSRKVMKEIKNKVFDDRIDTTELLQLKYGKRFKVYMGTRTGLNIDPDEILCICDTSYQTVSADYNLYNVYQQIKKREITKQEGIDIALKKAEDIVQELIVSGQHYFDKIRAQEKFDKEHGYKTDYSKFGL